MVVFDKKQELGELYKDLRMARGLKLKDIAREHLTISQLSKFELGQSMLSADRLLLAIAGLRMNFSEFAMAMNNYELDELSQYGYSLVKLRDQKDMDGFMALLPAKTETESLKLPMFKFINYIMIKNTMVSIDGQQRLTPAEIERLTQYFYRIEDWTGHEVYVFGNTTAIYGSQDLIFLSNHFWKASQKFLKLPTYRQAIKGTLINLIGTLIRKNDDYHARFFMDRLKEMLYPQELMDQAALKLLVAVLDCKNNGFQDCKQIDDILGAIGALSDESFVEQLADQIEQIKVALKQ